ncbi:MAG: MATE family efflux transporter [Oceanococcus sp.]|nr:MAG: MATE family efflux transporter [Oceanococcus sp.]
MHIVQLAWPIVLANCAAPLLGLVDTVVIGRTGQTHELGAIALGALIFSFLFWAFGFLRMGTTGFVARAAGAADTLEERAIAWRGVGLALALGLGLLVLQIPLLWLALSIFDASPAVEAAARNYLLIRIWSAPATLAGYVLTGWLIGVGRSKDVLRIQLLLNGLNILLDVYFAAVLGWGLEGIALGTVVAEWLALAYGLRVLLRCMRERHVDQDALLPWSRLWDSAALLALFSANRDLMIRTLLMLAAFAAFTNAGARFGDSVLAANHVLLQLISFSAFFLDGFAFAAEGLIGQAIGAHRREVFDVAVIRSSCLSALTASLIALCLCLLGEQFISLLTDLSAVREQARLALPWAATYVALSFVAFQLDGVFVGAARTATMRDTSLVSVLGFAMFYVVLDADRFPRALWLSFVAYVVLRGLTLLVKYPGLRREAFARPD